jgi:hypothetical protein
VKRCRLFSWLTLEAIDPALSMTSQFPWIRLIGLIMTGAPCSPGAIAMSIVNLHSLAYRWRFASGVEIWINGRIDRVECWDNCILRAEFDAIIV